jgi:hypothetical protein
MSESAIIATMLKLKMAVASAVLNFFGVGITAAAKPNIVFIVSDDLGFNDVSIHGSPQIPTTNLDGLARNGVLLHRYVTRYRTG